MKLTREIALCVAACLLVACSTSENALVQLPNNGMAAPLPDGFSGNAYFCNGAYYTGGHYESGRFHDMGRTFANRYLFNGSYLYGGNLVYLRSVGNASERYHYNMHRRYEPFHRPHHHAGW